MKISIIVAVGKNRQIGLNGNLPWKIKEDLQNFRRITMGHHIIMGRKTCESLGKALPGRHTIVLTKRAIPIFEGCRMAKSLNEAIEIARSSGDDEAFIVGGGSVYKEGLDLADRIYLSEVDYDGEADAFFPEFDRSLWVVKEKSEYSSKNGSPSWCFSLLDR